MHSTCRVCLVRDVRLRKIGEDIKEIYKTLVGVEDRMTRELCYICYSQLQKCKRFSDMALRSEKILSQLNCAIGNMAPSTIIPSPLLNLQVVENLSITIAQSDSINAYTTEDSQQNKHYSNYICINEHNPISVKIEVDVKKESYEESDDMVKSEDYEDDILQDTACIKSSNIANSLSDTKLHYCDVCNKRFATKSQMRTHLSVHMTKKSLNCGKCEKSFFKLHNLRKHIKICNTNTNTTHICTICNETFSNVTNLKRHLKTHSEERPFICDRCSNKFKTRTHLKVHMRIHGGEKPFACDICGKAFTQISNLKTHVKIHDGTKPFACEICGKAFLTNGTLKSHMRCHTGERPYSCNTCGMTFGFKCSLNQHIRRLHTEVKPYPCSQCHLSFNQEVSLTAHMRAHTTDRAYPCDKCSKAFTSARNLKGHNMQVHSGERPHGCTKCGKAYKRPEHLRQHLRSFKCKSVTLQTKTL